MVMKQLWQSINSIVLITENTIKKHNIGTIFSEFILNDTFIIALNTEIFDLVSAVPNNLPKSWFDEPNEYIFDYIKIKIKIE